MEKCKADAIITEYLQKIYGFAYKRSFTYDEAEDLASEMVYETYQSLLVRDEIGNTDGYIWRICEHTFAKYVAAVKRHKGISIDDIAEIPYFERFADDPASGPATDEKNRLRREIAYLSAQRRQIVFRFYYRNESIRRIASQLNLPEGTVKWHLNKARNELKEGLKMERKIGKLGMNPIVSCGFGHSGGPGKNNGPEYYLGDKLNLNIVYSVYFEPKNKEEIAEELGVTPVFIEDKIKMLEDNGYLVRTKDQRFTTFVCFSPRTYSRELDDTVMKKKLEAAKILVKEYVPLVRQAVADVECYIPGGNRQLLEAAAIFYGICVKCVANKTVGDMKKYDIKDLGGGDYIAFVYLEDRECEDPEYEETVTGDYTFCGRMERSSLKYPAVQSVAFDSRLDSRTGTWQNNLTTDYDFLYEYMTGKLADPVANAEKLNRLRERKFINEDGKVGIMVCRGINEDFFARVPTLDEKIKEQFAGTALELAMQYAKRYPPQMQDLIVARKSGFLNSNVAMMVLDELYADGTLRPLTEAERVTANLIMFSDVLPDD